MGVRGPVPNRSDDLSRDRDARRGAAAPVTKGQKRAATVPDADPNWHKIAKLIWDGAIESGQTDFYESSDYAMLYSICDDISHYKGMSKRSGQMLASIMSAMTSLLLTEGDRRRVRLELQGEDDEEDEGVDAQMNVYRNGLRAV